MAIKKLIAEAVGTALLVILAVGVATENFGVLHLQSHLDSGFAAGVVTTALAFGLTLLGLAYAFGPVSGCHVNPAVTMGFLVSGRIKPQEAVGYWIAQFAGGIAGALALWGIFSSSSGPKGAYNHSVTGLGADGWGPQNSALHISAGSAFATEVILTFFFVLVVLVVTSKHGSPVAAGIAIGIALAAVHLVGIPLTGTSVNPARSLGPAIVAGGDALNQVWLFIVAPLIGGALAAVCSTFLIDAKDADQESVKEAVAA